MEKFGSMELPSEEPSPEEEEGEGSLEKIEEADLERLQKEMPEFDETRIDREKLRGAILSALEGLEGEE